MGWGLGQWVVECLGRMGKMVVDREVRANELGICLVKMEEGLDVVK